jgi:predicted MPP superfamily phosphohydrolase
MYGQFLYTSAWISRHLYTGLGNMNLKTILRRRAFFKFTTTATTIAGFLRPDGKTYTRNGVPTWVDIAQLRLKLPNLNANFDGFRLIHISDIHMNSWMHRKRLEQVIRLVNAQRPDLLVLTGDFISDHASQHETDLVSAFSQVRTKYGAAAVLGNHDHWADAQMVRRVFKASGIRDLSNTYFTLERDGAQLHIAGVDDVIEKLDRLDVVLDSLPENGCAILLAHEPDYANISSACGRFDLQLSGHSHGGQVVLPIIGSPFLPPLGQLYPSGLYQVREMYQYTNRGLGMTAFHLRLNCRPEVTVLTLEAG